MTYLDAHWVLKSVFFTLSRNKLLIKVVIQASGEMVVRGRGQTGREGGVLTFGSLYGLVYD